MMFPKYWKNKYEVNCAICKEIPNQNIHYEEHIAKSFDRRNKFDRLPIGKYYLVVWKILVELF